MSVAPPIPSNPGEGKPPEVVQTENFVELVFEGQNTGYEADLPGNTAIAASKPVKKATFNAVTEEGETVVVAVQSKRVKQSDFTAEGEGSLELNVNTGTFAKNNVSGTDQADSLKFGNQATVKGTSTALGDGDDSVTFKKKVTVKGRNTIDLGEGGSDTVTLKGGAPEKGKLIITNFDENDTLVLKREAFTFEDLKDTKIEGIKIEFAE